MKPSVLALASALAALGGAVACSSSSPSTDPTPTPAPDAQAPTPDGGAPLEAGGGDASDGGKGDGGGDAGDGGVVGDAGDGGAIAPFCKTGDATCLDRLDIGGLKLPYYRSHPLGTPNSALKNIVLVVHGVNRNANEYFASMAAIAYTHNPAHTLVLAPYIQALPTGATPCVGAVDAPAAGDLYWSCGGWIDGNKATNAATTSYAAIDALVSAAKAAFPSVVRVTIVGYSAGGQTVQRMIAGSVEEDATPAVTTRWVVASPSSYLYFDSRRLVAGATCSDAATCALDATSFEAPFYDGASCPTYDDYKYGMLSRTGMLKTIPDATLLSRYVSRKVVYVVGEGDSDASTLAKYNELDKGCEATAQGPVGASFRYQRGLTYYHYATDALGATHRLVVVPHDVGGAPCGHDQACVFASSEAQAEIF